MHSCRRNASRDQVVLRRFRTLGAERKIVFARAALIGMAFDREGISIVLLQPARLFVERRLSGWREFDGIAVEKYAVADIDNEILLAARGGITRACTGKAAILGGVLRAGGDGKDRNQRTCEPQCPRLCRKLHPGTPRPTRPDPCRRR